MNEWLPILNTVINLLLIPLLVILNGIKTEIVRLNGLIAGLSTRVDRIERVQDK